MNIRRNVLKMVAIVLLAILAFAQSSAVYADTLPDGQKISIGIIDLREDCTPKMAYYIDAATKVPIWKIVEYKSDGSYENKNLYCLKSGAGFTETKDGEWTQKADYDVFFDMKKQRSQIKAQNTILQKLVDATMSVGDQGQTINVYNAVLALLDRIYLVGESTQEEKNVLFGKIVEEAGKQIEDLGEDYDQLINTQYILTDNDIDAIQQAVIWHFTNHDDEKFNLIKNSINADWFSYSLKGGKSPEYQKFSEYNKSTSEGKMRSLQMNLLYTYLVNEAKANANEYTEEKIAAATGAPVKVTTTSLTKEIVGANAVIGPINIAKQNNRPYTINFVVNNNGAATTEYSLLGANKQALPKETTVESLVGTNFYITLPAESVKDLSVQITVNYDERTMKVWASSSSVTEQPIAEVHKKNVSVPVTLTIPEEKPFDLALRKYITKVNGVALSGNNSRVPTENPTAIATGASVAYNHRKDPLLITPGDTVTYQIAIYNEGLKEGRATKIVDQLPTGLKFSKIVSGNFDVESYNETTNNTLNLVRKTTNKDNLAAYKEGSLSKEIIEIECIVTALPDATAKQKVLTNVAWISESYDAEAGKTITTEKGADVDSEPGTNPGNSGTAVNKDNMSGYTGNSSNKDNLADSNYYYKGQQDDDDFEKIVVSFDLKLLKFITQVNNKDVPNRVQSVDVSKLNTVDSNGNVTTTADYKLNKEPVPVQLGDIVTYTFRVYNEGTADGYAQEITENIPDGLEFIWSDKEGEELKADKTLTDEEKEAIEFNQKYLWGKFKYDESGKRITQISSDFLSKANETTPGANLLKAFGRNDGDKEAEDLTSNAKEISVKFRVVSYETSGSTIRNEAEISDDANSNGQPVEDRDSDPNKWGKENSDKFYDDDNKWPVYKEDDEDYDNVVLKAFDLAARKFIIAVSKDETIENSEYLRNSNGSYSRAPVVDTSKLNTLDEKGNMITTATYNHSKEPVEVEPGNIVVYMIRVYNEGDIDGYAGEIKDHLPSYLEFVDGAYNKTNGWTVSTDGRTVTTKILENKLIEKAKVDANGKVTSLSYVEVPIMCKVTDKAKNDEAITNIADITKYLDKDKEEVRDRDSEKNNVKVPEDKDLPTYNDDKTGSYIPGQEDDDDFEKVVVKPFDLALRKFITKVQDKGVDSRIPKVTYDAEKGQIKYEHSKDPVMVVTGNTVEYTIRIFNEGARNGYVAQILDDIPDGLAYVPERALNKEYRWKMYRELKDGENVGIADTIEQDGKTYIETEKASEADVIVTDYLSKEQGEKRMEDDDTLKENPNLLKAFNKDATISDKNPDYKDVKVEFVVTEPNTSDKVVVNSAQISDDTDENGNEVEDDDSEPGKWNEGEDDQDKEYVELRYFDLSLRKWVTQAIVIDNGKQTVTQTGHKPYDNPEQVVKVEIKQSKLNKVTVKFRYSIRVTNEGDIEGYAKEITDYVPQGLKFVAADNKGWTDEGNNVISTRQLENKLLKPGEYADVEVVLTWINGENGLGTVLNNTAEISEDYNEYGAPDRDSTPDNKKSGEDDIDDAPVILSIKTGQIRIYFTLGFIILITIASGVILIKKYVL